MVRWVMVVLCVLVLADGVWGGTIYVDAVNGNDGWAGTMKTPKQSIGAAITAAIDGDEIVVFAGTYTGANNRNLSFSKNIVIRSQSGAAVTIIDAEGVDRVFTIQGAPATARVEGFTIQNGYTDQPVSYSSGGSGIYLSQTAITIKDCIIKDCIGLEGAGLLIRNSTGTRIIDCVIQNNTGTHAYMSARAAGVYIFLSEDVEFTGCEFISNRVQPSGNGGAMYLYRYDATFRNCLFEGNYATSSGGVAYIEDGGLTFENCTFAGNSCGASGGCFWISYMGATHEAVCTNSIFRDNSAGGSGDVVYLSGVGTAGGVFRYGYCDINPSDMAHAALGGWVVQNLGGNVNVDPLFGYAGYWDSGVGEWIPGNYRLQSMVGRFNPITGGWVVDAAHSPCIDAGDPADDYSGEPGHNGERINMGAYGGTDEASQSPYCDTPIPADLTGDCRVDIEDFAELAAAWLNCNIVPAEFCW